jgi:hypothetical protein
MSEKTATEGPHDVTDQGGRDDYSGLKHLAKFRKYARMEAVAGSELADAWTKRTPTYWTREVGGKTMHFWPSTGKFRYGNGAVKRGTRIESVEAYIQAIIKNAQ